VLEISNKRLKMKAIPVALLLLVLVAAAASFQDLTVAAGKIIANLAASTDCCWAGS